MTIVSTANSSIALNFPKPASVSANVLTIAARELRDSTGSRWFLLYTLAFTALGLGVSYVSAAGSGGSGLASFGRTAAGLVNLVLLVVPLMALTAGAGTIASDRERGMLQYLLALPVSRFEVMLGKYLGLAGTLLACITLGLGSCALILAFKGMATDPRSIMYLAALSFALALGMLSIGMLISTLAHKASVAVGTAVFAWLFLVFGTDLGLMASTLAFKIRIAHLFAVCAANPLQVFKMWSLHSIDATLDVLGPAGLYASEELGPRIPYIFSAVFAAWIVLPLSAAIASFSRKAPI